MIDLIFTLQNTPAPTLLILGGMILLFLGLAGGISGRVEIPVTRQRITGILGGVFVLLGLLLFVVPARPIDFSGNEIPDTQTEQDTEIESVSDEESSDASLPEPTESASILEIDPVLDIDTAREWPAVHIEDFDDNISDVWEEGFFETAYDDVTYSFINGAYHLEIAYGERDDVGFQWTVPAAKPVTNFYLAVDCKLLEGDEDETRYGLIFRIQGLDYYTYRIEDGSYFKMRKHVNSEWISLFGNVYIPDVTPGEWVRLELIAIDDTFSFYINEEYVGQISDDALAFGNVGLIVFSDDPSGKVSVMFDNFELREQP